MTADPPTRVDDPRDPEDENLRHEAEETQDLQNDYLADECYEERRGW